MTGQEGLERASSEVFDLILLDVLLPKKDGYTVCRELRGRSIRTPILILTGLTGETDKVLGLEFGADDYVCKPFSSLELRARVRALMRRGARETSNTFRFGDIDVDFEAAQIRRNGTPIETTRLEFKLLDIFVHNRGRILTRQQLLDKVWQAESEPFDRAVDNHIMYLRRKIEPDPKNPIYLVSIRGLGYRFDG